MIRALLIGLALSCAMAAPAKTFRWASQGDVATQAKRQQLINQAVGVLQREVLVIPLHCQVIPWVSRANVKLVHRSDNKFAPLWVRMD